MNSRKIVFFYEFVELIFVSTHWTYFRWKRFVSDLKKWILPVLTSQSLTVPSSEDVMTKWLLNCRQVTADWCLLGPESVCRQWPLTMSQTLTVESALPDTKILLRSSIPEVRDWCPIRVCLQAPVSTSHTLILVSSEPLTTWTPSNFLNRAKI